MSHDEPFYKASGKYRIRVGKVREYSGYFWAFEEYLEPRDKKQDGYWSKRRGAHAFTYRGAYWQAKREAKKYLRFEPFEKIEELG